MAFAVTGYRLWGIETSKAVSPEGEQVMELDLTGANTDVAYDFGSSGGTFWTSAEAHGTYGATATAAKKALYDIAGKSRYSLTAEGAFTEDYLREAAVDNAAYTEASGTVVNTRNLAFKSGFAPTSWTLVLRFKLLPGVQVQTY